MDKYPNKKRKTINEVYNNGNYDDYDVTTNNRFVLETNVEVDKLSIFWKIRNFSLLPNTSKSYKSCFKSPTFSTSDHPKHRWFLRLKLDESNSKYWSCFLFVLAPSYPVKASVTFKIMKNNDMEVGQNVNCQFEKFEGCGIHNFIIRNGISDYLDDDDTLTMHCIVEFSTGLTKHYTVPSNNNASSLPKLSISETIFDKKILPDVTIKIGREEIELHKCILSASSHIFAAMFETNMKEKQTNQVIMKDVSYESAYEFFRYIYTGKIRNLKILYNELMLLADKYVLVELKDYLEVELTKIIDINNALSLLELSRLYDFTRFNSFCVSYILKCGKEIIEKPEFQELKKSSPHLIADLYSSTVMLAKKN